MYEDIGGGVPSPLSRVRGRRLGGQGHLGQLAKLHPNHPIFHKFPGLASFVRSHAEMPQMPPGVVPPPGSETAPDTGQRTAPPIPAPGEVPSYMQNIPTDMTGYGGWGSTEGPTPEGDPMAHAQDQIRSRLMQRFHTAAPQEPMLTSRNALRQHLRRQTGRMAQRRQPMLPLRRPY